MENEPYLIYQPPPRAGHWLICGDLEIYTLKRPNWFHRLMAAYLLGWKWIDADAA